MKETEPCTWNSRCPLSIACTRCAQDPEFITPGHTSENSPGPHSRPVDLNLWIVLRGVSASRGNRRTEKIVQFKDTAESVSSAVYIMWLWATFSYSANTCRTHTRTHTHAHTRTPCSYIYTPRHTASTGETHRRVPDMVLPHNFPLVTSAIYFLQADAGLGGLWQMGMLMLISKSCRPLSGQLPDSNDESCVPFIVTFDKCCGCMLCHRFQFLTFLTKFGWATYGPEFVLSKITWRERVDQLKCSSFCFTSIVCFFVFDFPCTWRLALCEVQKNVWHLLRLTWIWMEVRTVTVCIHMCVWQCTCESVSACVGECVLVSGHVCACMFVESVCIIVYACVTTRVWIRVCVHTYGCVHTWVAVRTCVSGRVHVWLCVSVCVSVKALWCLTVQPENQASAH